MMRTPSRRVLPDDGGPAMSVLHARARGRVKDEALVAVGARIPPDLHRQVRVHCIQRQVRVQDFINAAIRERLVREQRRHPQ